ncbi:DUF4389 domain-containing protein [Bacteroidota bacterium]
MKLSISYQESYSRAELLLRTLFGFIYIVLPHMFLLFFVGIWSSILSFIAWWVILFTGKYPQSFFEFQVDYYKWNIRVSSRILNLSDGYPAFGIKGSDEFSDFQMPYPESLSRGLLLLRTFFGWLYVGIPHGFMLFFRMIGTYVLVFLAWWVVLFTGKYPENWHVFNVGTLRWNYRVSMYLLYMTDEYPPFTGKEIEPTTETTEITEQQ